LDEIDFVLQGLAAEKAKRRESTILKLTPAALRDPRVIVALTTVMETDPQEYARVAAHNALSKAGVIPDAPYVASIGATGGYPQADGIPWTSAPVVVNTEPQKENVGLVVLGVAVVALVVCVPVLMITALAVMGPQIGNIFSRVSSGLGAP
jgi:hypothetical protein